MSCSLSRSNSLKRSELAEIVMQRIQSCPWSQFRFNEIVTLERCLQETSVEDPRVTLLLRKLACSAVFVEPERKLTHLSRDDSEKRADMKLKAQASLMKEEIERRRLELEHYSSRFDYLSEGDTKQQIEQLETEILLMERNYESARKELNLTLERINNSFNKSITAVNLEIPEFIRSVLDGNLVKQSSILHKSYNRYLLKLIKSSDSQQHSLGQPTGGAQQEQSVSRLTYCIKLNMVRQMKRYMSSLAALLRDLLMVNKVYESELPAELELMRCTDQHVELLANSQTTGSTRGATPIPKLAIGYQTTLTTPIEEASSNLRANLNRQSIELPLETCDHNELDELFAKLEAARQKLAAV